MRLPCLVPTYTTMGYVPRSRRIELPDPNLVRLLDVVAETLDVETPPLLASHGTPDAHVNQWGRIIYNPAFVRGLLVVDPSGRSVIGVLGHELGHVMRRHVHKPFENPHTQELEADYIAGYVLGEHCEDPRRFVKVMQLIAGRHGTPTHPSGRKRQAAIVRGWLASESVCSVA